MSKVFLWKNFARIYRIRKKAQDPHHCTDYPSISYESHQSSKGMLIKYLNITSFW
jgi:hypothetical protein